jgi:undecaprenyl-diphosphatase
MLEETLIYERGLFLALNGCNSPYWDEVMWLLTNNAVWIPWLTMLACTLLWGKNWRERLPALIAIGAVFVVCNQFSNICKEIFMRPRPSYHPDFRDFVHIAFNYRSGGFGFFSSHAASYFGIATFISLLFRRKRLITATFFPLAAFLSYARIYLGVHFISDVIAGMIAGIFLGFTVFAIYEKLRQKTRPHSESKEAFLPNRLSGRQQGFLLGGIIATVATVLVFHSVLMKIYL